MTGLDASKCCSNNTCTEVSEVATPTPTPPPLPSRRRRSMSCEGLKKRAVVAVQRSLSVGARIAADPSCSLTATVHMNPPTRCPHPFYRCRRDSTSCSYTAASTTTEEEKEQLEEMLRLLSQEEVEQAARTNYHYFKKVIKTNMKSTVSSINSNPESVVNNEDRNDLEEEVDDSDNDELTSLLQWRRKCATDMALRYLRSKRDVRVAVEKMKATLQFRRDWKVDRLRLAFDCDTDEWNECDDENDSGDDDVDSLIMKQALEKQLQQKAVYVQGYDNEGRATFVFEPHRVTSHEDAEYTIKMHIYTLERAVACSKAKDKTVNAVVNFGAHFSITKHAPPTHIGKQFLTTLRSHYTGHVHQIFLIDAPIAFHWLWTIFKPFVGRQTKDKIHFVYGVKQESLIGKLYNTDQATAWMLPLGEKNRELDLDEYLASPFDTAFDEKR